MSGRFEILASLIDHEKAINPDAEGALDDLIAVCRLCNEDDLAKSSGALVLTDFLADAIFDTLSAAWSRVKFVPIEDDEEDEETEPVPALSTARSEHQEPTQGQLEIDTPIRGEAE